MMLSFSKHTGASDGAGRRAIAYLLAPEWKKTVDGQKVVEHRVPPPEILRGDPRLVQAAIEAAPGALKYTMAVASFHRDDVDVARFNSGDERERAKVNAYLDDWQAAAFAGLPRASWPPHLISTHTHTGRLEINLLIPRAIMVGDRLKAHNVAPPGPATRRLFNALEDKHNSLNNWADPRDPTRQRSVKVPDYIEKEKAARTRANAMSAADGGPSGVRPTSRKDVRSIIADQIARAIDAGRVANRDQVLQHLAGAGFQISRTTKNSITILDPADQKRIRLEGPVFRTDFEAAGYLEARRREHPSGATEREFQRDEFLITAPARLEREVAFRAETNRRLAAEIAAATPQSEPIDLDADRIYFSRLPDLEPDNPLEFLDDDRDPSPGRPGIHGRVRVADLETVEADHPGRTDRSARPGQRPRASTADHAAHAGADRRANRPSRAPGRPGTLPLPDAILARSRRTGTVFVNKNDLHNLSRRHLDRGSQISASVLQGALRDGLEHGRPANLDEMRRRSARDRRLASQSARLAREGWSLEKRTEWKQKYLDHLYSGPPLDADLLRDIRYIDNRNHEIQFWDGCRVIDHGDRIVADWATASSIELLVAQARAAGWQSVRFSGRERDVAALVAESHRVGLQVEGQPPPSPAPQPERAPTPTAQGAPERPEMEESSAMTPATPSPKPRRARPPKFTKDPPGYVDRIRREVDLPALAIGYGYEVDREKTSQKWISMRHRESGRRLLMNRDEAEGWRWQDPQTRLGGDAFHLVADARGLDPKRYFASIKKELAGLVGASPTDFTPPRPPASIAAPEPPRDFSEIRATWERAGRDPAPTYLTRDRLVPRQVLSEPRFADTHRQIGGETAFPYVDASGQLVGYERRRSPTNGEPKASYSKGGSAGIWQSNLTPDDTALVVVESPIDAYSHFALLQLDRCPTTRYVALRTGQAATAALRAAIKSMPADAVIVGACDRGEAGERYQKLIESVAKEERRRFVEHRARLKDWNDQLRHQVTKVLELRDHLDRQAQAAPTAPERPAAPAAVQGPEEQRRAEIEELEDDGPEMGM